MSYRNIIGFFTSAVLLASCGGGGSSSSTPTTSSSPTTTVSTPPPAPTSVMEGATDFRSDSMTRAEFTPNGLTIFGFKDVDDVDAFVLNVPQRQTVSVSILGDTLEFPSLQLLDEDGEPVALNQAITFNDYADLDNLAQVTVLLESGRYLVRLVDPLVFVNGAPDFSAARDLSGTYEVKAETVIIMLLRLARL